MPVRPLLDTPGLLQQLRVLHPNDPRFADVLPFYPTNNNQRNPTMTTTRTPAARPVKKAAPRKAAAATKKVAAPKLPPVLKVPEFKTVEEAKAFYEAEIVTIGNEITAAAKRNRLCDTYYKELATINSKLAVKLPAPKKVKSVPVRQVYVGHPTLTVAGAVNNFGELTTAGAKSLNEAIEKALTAGGFGISAGSKFFQQGQYTSETWLA